jgi:hypothetical protein
MPAGEVTVVDAATHVVAFTEVRKSVTIHEVALLPAADAK